MRKKKIKIKFIIHKALVSVLWGTLFAGCLITGCAHKTPESQNKAGIDSVTNILNSALNEARASKTGSAVIDLYNSPETVQTGDLVGVRYCLTLENGEILRTNIREILESSETTLSENYIESNDFNDLEVLAGERDAFPGLHSGVLGMKKGGTNKILIAPEEGYGPRSDDRIRTFSSVKLIPKKTGVSQEKFKELFRSAPVIGSPVRLVPYFNHRIVEISENEVILEAEIDDSFSLESDIGNTRISPEENHIALILEPRLGAEFSVGNEKGKIASIHEKSFTVDFNHPLAGENLLLELTVDSVIKASTVETWKIPWHEDYDEGLAIAEKTGKPVALILYKDGCQWCERLFKTTMKDPRIEYFENEFIWIKVNEKERPELMEIYKTDSYPSIVLLDTNGEVIEKMLGYKYAYTLRDNLSSVLQKMEKVSGFASADKGPVKHHLNETYQ